jgi:hypothetical protein
MEILIILIVILVVFYFSYLSSKNNKLTKTEAFYSPDYITMYEHNDYRGEAFDCPVGFTGYLTLNRRGWNDKASSIIIPEGLAAVFYEDANRGGRIKHLSAGSYPSLGDWNDRISSLDVYRV